MATFKNYLNLTEETKKQTNENSSHPPETRALTSGANSPLTWIFALPSVLSQVHGLRGTGEEQEHQPQPPPQPQPSPKSPNFP